MKDVKVKEEVKKEAPKKEAPKKEAAVNPKKNEALATFMEDRNAKRVMAGLKAAYSEEEIKTYK